MKKAFLLGICVFFVATLVGCNATKGAGKDLEKTGENIQETVDKNM